MSEYIDVLKVKSTKDRDLGVFLIFSGIVGGIPLYYIFSKLILRLKEPDLTLGFLLSLVVAALGFLVINVSKKSIRVSCEGQSGNIEIRDGLWGSNISYPFKDGAKIRFSLSEQTKGVRISDIFEIVLIDGRYQYMLDSRIDDINVSRNIAEFLVKSMKCNLLVVLESSRTVEMSYEDVDLPYKLLAKKYPELVSEHPIRPEDCSVDISDIDGGTGRLYRWGISGLFNETITMAILVAIFSLSPILGEADERFSLFSEAMRNGNWSFFYIVFLLFGLILTFQSGYSVSVRISGEKLNISKQIWGVSYSSHDIFLDDLEDILARKSTSGGYIVFISDNKVISLKQSQSEVSEYVVSDIQHFLTVASKKNSKKEEGVQF